MALKYIEGKKKGKKKVILKPQLLHIKLARSSRWQELPLQDWAVITTAKEET